LDVSQFESDADKARFARAFSDRFFFRKKAAPSAVHVFIEECQEFAPQNPQREEAAMLHAFTRLVKIGRNFGIGVSLLSQRPQEVNKKVLSDNPRRMVRLYNERAARGQERAELAEQFADNMPRRGRLTWTIRRGGEAPGRDLRSARARPPMTARLALIGAALLLATSCNFNESRWVLRRGRPQRAALSRCA
jgi:hypothetical protein